MVREYLCLLIPTACKFASDFFFFFFFFFFFPRCFIEGMKFNPMKIFQPVTFPVGRGTNMIGSLVKWNHDESWAVPRQDQFLASGTGNESTCIIKIDASNLEAKDYFLLDHKIDGRVLYPATGYLVLAWRVLARLHGCFHEQLPVLFQDITIHRATIVPQSGKTCYTPSQLLLWQILKIKELQFSCGWSNFHQS